MKLYPVEIDRCWLTAAHTAAAVPGLLLKDFKNWSDRGLVHWHGERLKVYQKRIYSLRSVVEAYALHAMQQADVPLDPHGRLFAETMVKRLRHHQARGIEYLQDIDETDQDVLVYAFEKAAEGLGLIGRFVSANEPLSELMYHLPIGRFNWELRLFPVDYALAKLLETYLEYRRILFEAFERGVTLDAGAPRGTGDVDQTGGLPAA